MNKALIVALTTYKESVRLPLFYVLACFFGAVIFFSKDFTLFGFNKELTIIKEVALATIMIAGILQSVLLAGTTITSDVERKTYMMILSKPISRTQFLIGKFLGILLSVFSSASFLFMVMVLTLWYAQGYPELKEMSQRGFPMSFTPEQISSAYWDHLASFAVTGMLHQAGYFLLALMQIGLMCALTVMLSSFFPLALNAGICFFVFVLGNMSYNIYDVCVKSGSSVVSFLGTAVYMLLPNLSYMNPSAGASYGLLPSVADISIAFSYCLVYTLMILVAGSAVFNRTEMR